MSKQYLKCKSCPHLDTCELSDEILLSARYHKVSFQVVGCFPKKGRVVIE